MGEVLKFPPQAERQGGNEEKEGKLVEFKRKLAEESPAPGMELKESVEMRVSGEDLHAILVGLVHERNALKKQMEEIKDDPELEGMLGPMVEGLLQKNAELLTRLSSQDPALEAHFKKAIE